MYSAVLKALFSSILTSILITFLWNGVLIYLVVLPRLELYISILIGLLATIIESLKSFIFSKIQL